MKKILRCSLLVIIFMMTICPNLWADDVLNILEEAVKQYKNGDYSAAASNLDYASQLIRQKKSEHMKQLLPEPLAGWEAEAADAQAIGTAVFGSGVNVSRTYKLKEAVITVDIVTDSPVIQSMVMMLNNPMLIGASGGKLEVIKGQKAIVKYDETALEGEVNIVVGNNILVTIKGQKTGRADLLAYAAAVDYEALKKN